jgi:DNA-directed RNA polymerase specialized sigma24 family protein
MKEKPTMTYTEIAQAIGINEKTVRTIERRALEKIRRIFHKRKLFAKDFL